MLWIRFCPLLASLLALCLFGGQACSPPIACKNDRISDTALNPAGSKCTKTCQCNNQSYRGACVDGKCVTFKRGTCQARGAQRICHIEASLGGSCREGIQVCKPEYLTSDRWGDCDPNCQACQPGDTQPCYDGPEGTLNTGICAAGTKTCTVDKTWGACEGQKVPTTEVCNGKDDDCNGKIDDDCTNPTEHSPGETPAAKERPQNRSEKAPDAGGPETPREVVDGGMREAPPETPDNGTQEAPADTQDASAEKPPEKPPAVCIAGQSQGCRIGICTGTQTCDQSGQWGTCVATSTPQTEVCNGKDDDCDGTIDENLPRCVSTFAGGGDPYYLDGPAKDARFGEPWGLTSDLAGNFYVADNVGHRIRKIDTKDNVTTIAGNGKAGFADGQGTSAQFNKPVGLALDALGNLYVADSGNHRIRKIDPKGNVTTFAGSGTRGTADGQGTSAQFNTPTRLALDAQGNLYVSDGSNHRIRKIDPKGKVTTFAGSTQGYLDGQGTNAQFFSPQGLAIDAAGNLYVADSGNRRIRKIDPQGKVTTFAGEGRSGSVDGPDTIAQFSSPQGLAIDAAGNLYVADTPRRLRKITRLTNATCGNYSGYSGTCIRTLAGGSTTGYSDAQGTKAQFYNPRALALDANGNLTVADSDNNLLRKVDPKGNVTTFAGTLFGYRDGKGIYVQFRDPMSVQVDSTGNLYVTDTTNHRIRKIDPKGNVTTFAGSGTRGFADGQGTSAQFNSPTRLALDAQGNLYVSEGGNNRIRKIDPKGNVTTFAGNGTAGFKDGQGISAQFKYPRGLAFDTAGNLYVADTNNNRIRKIDTKGNVTTFAGSGTRGTADGQGTSAQFHSPDGLAFDGSGNLYVSEGGTHRIRKIDPKGNVTTFAGSGTAGSKDGQGISAQFYSPSGLAFDTAGNLYVAGYYSRRIRKIDPKGNVTTFAGSGTAGSKDGQGISAQFNTPNGLAFDAAGNLYVADRGNRCIRKIPP